jgi:hypothetical protein
MAVDPSAYAVLGLEPSADVPTIERAYRKLIKEHHPDRGGEDSSRAAEIIEAYRAIRAERHLKDPLELNEHWLEEGQGSRAWVAFAGLLALATVFLLLTQGPLAPLTEGIASPGIGAARKADPAISGGMDQPLHTNAIDIAVRDALTLARTSDEIGLAKESRDCHHLLRMSPSVVQLDRCAAFDDAVVQLQDRDPLRDQGPFSELAVTGRNWSGATALSDDAVAIDNRLDRIRLRVEFALAPVVQSGPPPPRK